jgi:phospho-N-acetylmuramoyl-pentapeptide-transferase
MLHLLSSYLQQYFGPFRLLESHSFLIVLGLYGGFFLTQILLPRLSRYLPMDRGREFAVQKEVAIGKPTGAGIIFILVFTFVAFITVPFGLEQSIMLVLTCLIMLSGYLDDRSTKPWNEYLKGSIDLGIALAASIVFAAFGPLEMWLPFTTSVITMPTWLFIPGGTILLWISINITNCSDGVDGLSGTLVMLGLISLGLILYFVLGHVDISTYLLLPHYPDGARWAIMIFCLVGCLASYLWYNAYPSSVLMGDAGSRAVGFFFGISIINTGNPFLLFTVSTVLLVNGGTGIVKVALLRFLKIRIFHNTRFPLHDHVREYMKWSNSQVLIKFAIIQILITIGLLGIFFKIR